MILTSPDQLSFKPTKIISLVPSQTELLHYFGLEEETIAITKFCVHPGEWFRHKTRIGGTKAIHIEQVKALKPDLIIANKEENVKEQVEEIAADFPVWVTDVNNLADAYKMIRNIGILTGKENTANELVEAIKLKFDQLFQQLPVKIKIPAAYIIWKDPFMTIGADTFINSMMDAAGFKNVFEQHKRYPEISIDQLRDSGCKVILLSSEPYPFKQKHIDEMQKDFPGIKIMLVDGEMFSWYGSRLLLAPAYFSALHSAMSLPGPL